MLQTLANVDKLTISTNEQKSTLCLHQQKKKEKSKRQKDKAHI